MNQAARLQDMADKLAAEEKDVAAHRKRLKKLLRWEDGIEALEVTIGEGTLAPQLVQFVVKNPDVGLTPKEALRLAAWLVAHLREEEPKDEGEPWRCSLCGGTDTLGGDPKTDCACDVCPTCEGHGHVRRTEEEGT